VRGSFAYGDFHFGTSSGRSLSDLDLLHECGEEERHQRARRVERRLLARYGIRLRVSVQPDDHHAGLSTADGRFLAIGEYLRHHFEYANDSARRSYLLAKTALSLLRTAADERYPAIASAINTAESRLALSVKLGHAGTFSRDEAFTLLCTQRGEGDEARCMRQFLGARLTVDAYRAYLIELRTRTKIDPWLKNLMWQLISDAMPWGTG
jgi:hypothetical protein